MGMFDTLTCEYPLPVPEAQAWSFQTKDLDCELKQYVITKDGRLLKHEHDYEETPLAEKPYPKAKPGTWRYLFGIMRPCNKRTIEVPYDGDIHFYDYITGDDPRRDKYGQWVEFRATFRNGKVAEMKLMEGD